MSIREWAAGRRWRAINAANRAAGCPCGKPATSVVRRHDVLGSVPAETWTCAEHVGVAFWSMIEGQSPVPHRQPKKGKAA